MVVALAVVVDTSAGGSDVAGMYRRVGAELESEMRRVRGIAPRPLPIRRAKTGIGSDSRLEFPVIPDEEARACRTAALASALGDEGFE